MPMREGGTSMVDTFAEGMPMRGMMRGCWQVAIWGALSAKWMITFAIVDCAQ